MTQLLTRADTLAAQIEAGREANRRARATTTQAVAKSASKDPIDPSGRMNKTERRRAQELEVKRTAGLIRSWQFSAIALVLADDTRYYPDFLVVERDESITIEEVKGHWRDDARVKIKVAARQFPFWTFQAYRRRTQKQGGGWDVETIRP